MDLSLPGKCPRMNLPDFKAECIKSHCGMLTFRIGPGKNDLVFVTRAYGMPEVKVGDKGVVQYYSWNRADHHRHWDFVPDTK